jgi:hypothetical protein
MSSIMRRRRGLIVAIWNSCLERDGCDNPILSDRRLPISSFPIAAVPLFPRSGFVQCARMRSRRSQKRVPNNAQSLVPNRISYKLTIAWFAKSTFRSIIRLTGRSFFADETNLNLVSYNELWNLTEVALNLSEFQFELDALLLCGWTSNFVLTVHRNSRGLDDEGSC